VGPEIALEPVGVEPGELLAQVCTVGRDVVEPVELADLVGLKPLDAGFGEESGEVAGVLGGEGQGGDLWVCGENAAGRGACADGQDQQLRRARGGGGRCRWGGGLV